MHPKTILVMLLALIVLLPAQWGFAEVEWQSTRQLKLEDTPLDMKYSRDGQWMYLLTEKGQLLVYDFRGDFMGSIDLGKDFDAIEPGSLPDEVLLLSRKNKSIQAIEVSPKQEIDVSQAPFKGPADAPVVIVEYTDFQCPYCAKLLDVFKELIKIYPDKLKIVYKSFPLGNHKFAYRAAVAALAAHRKGRFWEFHDRLFEYGSALNEAKIDVLRKEFGFDTPEFSALMADPEIRAQVAKDRNEGQLLGIRGTPTVYINGKQLIDKRLEGFQAAIEKELKKHQK